METTGLRIGVTGCGHAARTHLARLAALDGVSVVGLADPDRSAADALASQFPPGSVRAFGDHLELLREVQPDVLAIFTPHLAHYRAAMDALQAGCHVFVEKPLSTNVQEAVDIVNVARGRGKTVGVGHQYRLLPSLVETRRLLHEGAIGRVRLASAVMAQPWLASHGGVENSWRFDPKVAGGGILADAGDHLIDALLWTTGQESREVSAIQSRLESGLDVVTAATIRLGDDLPVILGLCGVSSGTIFEISFYGERGRLRVTDRTLVSESVDGSTQEIPLPNPAASIDSDFISAIRQGRPPCCPADQALATVRLLEGVARSAATGQVVRL